jgi:hypothetical protein
VADRLLGGIREMEDSVTYQAIVRKGQLKEARGILVRLGTRKFGAPSPTVCQRVEATTDLESLERMIDRLQTSSSWNEALCDES